MSEHRLVSVAPPGSAPYNVPALALLESDMQTLVSEAGPTPHARPFPLPDAKALKAFPIACGQDPILTDAHKNSTHQNFDIEMASINLGQ